MEIQNYEFESNFDAKKIDSAQMRPPFDVTWSELKESLKNNFCYNTNC